MSSTSFLGKISIKNKLISLVAIFFLVLVGSIAVAFFSIKSLNSQLEDLAKVHMPAVRNMTLADMMHDGLRAIVYRAFIEGDNQEAKGEINEELNTFVADFQTYIKEIESFPLEDSVKKAIAQAKPALNDYIAISQEIVQLALDGKRDEANAKMPAFKEGFENLEKGLFELGELIEKGANESIEHGAKVSKSSFALIMLIALISIVVSIFGFIFSRLISAPLIKIVDSFRDISEGEGDLTKRLPVNSEDELGMLAKWFNIFIIKIEEIIAQVKDNARQLNAATEEVSNSAQKISDGAQQQSASFEELSGSVQSNATNAQAADDLSQKVFVNAQQTGEEMTSTIEAMSAIEKSSKQITEAVAIITDIADQTNLLALNAAIEAARAGEHGKGFAVVADEVRKLAERSASSAKDIIRLITESSTQVQTGVKLACDSGEKLKTMVGDISKVAEQLKAISTATQEQAATMEENTSITESNAGSAEGLASSAEEMAAQAQNLEQLVGRFKVGSIAHIHSDSATEDKKTEETQE